jgi:hypothetical protein
VSAIYLFCFARSRDLSDIAGTGIDRESPLEIRRAGELAAVTSATPLEDFTGEGAEARMRDVEWLAPRALWHERVIEEVARSSPVLPARLGTIFSSSERLTELMERHHDAIAAFLDRVADREEWAIKAYLDRRAAVSHRAQPTTMSTSPGTRYLEAQLARAAAERDLARWVAETCARVRDELRAIAGELVERQVIPAGSDRVPGQMVANWAVLVARERVADLRARVAELDEELAPSGLRLQESGAWPPYSFTPRLDDEGARDADRG